MSQRTRSSRAQGRAVVDDVDTAGAHTVGAGTSDGSWKDNVLGNARGGRVQNVSWGAIFAGVVTFLAVVFLFSLLTAAFGLDGSGTGAAVVSIIGVLLAFFAGGGVAGAMAVRGGLVHGFLTWATSILATVFSSRSVTYAVWHRRGSGRGPRLRGRWPRCRRRSVDLEGGPVRRPQPDGRAERSGPAGRRPGQADCPAGC